jgi:Protein involved in initiation of plasmid replication
MPQSPARLLGQMVRKSNALIMAKWQPESIWEPRIVALVASKVTDSDKDFLIYRIPVMELLGNSGGRMTVEKYKEVAKSIERLRKATVRINGDRPCNFRQYSIFAMCGYENDYLVAQFHPDLKPHFLQLSTQFTAYKLFEYLALPSIYSQRLYELLLLWSSRKSVELPLRDMHQLLATPQFMRENFKDFRVRVIEKSQKDIKEKTGLDFDWEPVKQGRAVVAVRFFFARECGESRLPPVSPGLASAEKADCPHRFS